MVECEEVEHLRKTVKKRSINRYDPIWIKAFRLYRDGGNSSLSMRCGICYIKVLRYIVELDCITVEVTK